MQVASPIFCADRTELCDKPLWPPERSHNRSDPAPPLERLEPQADDLLNFQGPTDLTTWLAAIAKLQNRVGTRR